MLRRRRLGAVEEDGGEHRRNHVHIRLRETVRMLGGDHGTAESWSKESTQQQGYGAWATEVHLKRNAAGGGVEGRGPGMAGVIRTQGDDKYKAKQTTIGTPLATSTAVLRFAYGVLRSMREQIKK